MNNNNKNNNNKSSKYLLVTLYWCSVVNENAYIRLFIVCGWLFIVCNDLNVYHAVPVVLLYGITESHLDPALPGIWTKWLTSVIGLWS